MADLWKTGRGPGAPKKLVPRLCIAVSCKSNELRRRSRAKPKDFVGSLTCRICSYVICDTYKVCVYIYIYLYIYMYTCIHTLHYITLHCIALHCFSLLCIALHCMHTHTYIYIYLCPVMSCTVPTSQHGKLPRLHESRVTHKKRVPPALPLRTPKKGCWQICGEYVVISLICGKLW